MSFKGLLPTPFSEEGQGSENLRQQRFVQISGYEIECEIGRGGMATVYRALQQSLGRQVAIKILAHGPEEDSEFAQRFKKEGRILARLLHPNIITIHDVGISENNQLFLSVEYLPGGTLGDRIKQGLSFDSAIHIARAIAKALGYAHQRGVIHRDVKPSNIMFRHDGTPVLTDFGVARVVESKTIHTMSGLTIGSPGYMSPEQAMGDSATIQSDLYSLGVVIYEMLAGHRLYEAGNPLTITLKHLYDPIPDLPKQYAHLQPVLAKLLAKKSSDRYKNTGEFLEALDLIVPSDTGAQPRVNTDISHISLVEFTTGKVRSLFKKRSRLSIAILIVSIMAIFIAIAIFYIFKPGNSLDQIKILESGKQHEQEVVTLLKLAEMQLKAGLLAGESKEDNAEATYQRVLTLDPGNAHALAGLETIAKEYEKRARQQLDGGALQESLHQIKLGLAAAPKNAELLRLRQEVERRMTDVSAQKAREEEQQQSQLQAEQFVAQAQSDLQEGLLEISLTHIEQGLLAMPGHPGLLALRQQVKARVAEQQRQEEAQRQAKIAERQKAEQAQRQKAEQARQQEEEAQRQKAEQARQQEEEAQRQTKIAERQKAERSRSLPP
ncbi:MAG: protein kinase [Candidatus Contendobacter sp.]